MRKGRANSICGSSQVLGALETPLHFHRRFLAFERAILTAVHQALPESSADLMARQVMCVNKIQRLLDWQEVEFYCMRWFKVAWPGNVLAPNTGEIEVARATLESSSGRMAVSVFWVLGHLFSIESKQSMRPFRNVSSPKVSEVQFLRDPMVAG